jgi:amino acid transporter
VTGWSNWLGQVTGAPSVDYSLAAMILAAASIQNPSYVPTNYQTFLLTILLMIIHAIISSMPTRWIAQFNSIGSTFNMVALVIVFVVILAADNRVDQGLPRFNDSASVWGDFYEGTDFPKGVSLLMSFIAVIWTMSGYDSPFHLSEECSNASIASPRAIVMTSGIGGVVGWAFNMAIAYTVVDIDAALNSDSGQPFAAYLMQCMGQKTAMACLSLTIIASFSMGQGCMVAASRVTFAYARDGCFPLSSFWARVNPHTKTPVNAVWFNTIIGCLILLLLFAGDTAIGAIFSIGAIGAFVAFTIPITIRTFFVGDRFRPGPWNLGKYSYVVGVFSTMFTLLMIPILCLPSVTGSDLDADGMNWTIVVWGGPMLFAIIWFVVDAHKWFKGPKINIAHMIHAEQEEQYVIQAQPADIDGTAQPIVPSKKDDLSAA